MHAAITSTNFWYAAAPTTNGLRSPAFLFASSSSLPWIGTISMWFCSSVSTLAADVWARNLATDAAKVSQCLVAQDVRRQPCAAEQRRHVRRAAILDREDERHRAGRVPGHRDGRDGEIAERDLLAVDDVCVMFRNHGRRTRRPWSAARRRRVFHQLSSRRSRRTLSIRTSPESRPPHRSDRAWPCVTRMILTCAGIQPELAKAWKHLRVDLVGLACACYRERVDHQQPRRRPHDVDRGAAVADRVHVVEDSSSARSAGSSSRFARGASHQKCTASANSGDGRLRSCSIIAVIAGVSGFAGAAPDPAAAPPTRPSPAAGREQAASALFVYLRFDRSR